MSKYGAVVTVELKGNTLKAVIPILEGEENSEPLTQGIDYTILTGLAALAAISGAASLGMKKRREE